MAPHSRLERAPLRAAEIDARADAGWIGVRAHQRDRLRAASLLDSRQCVASERRTSPAIDKPSRFGIITAIDRPARSERTDPDGPWTALAASRD